MPRELSASEEVMYSRYLALGTPDEIQRQIAKLRKEAGKYRVRANELEEKLKTAAIPEGGRVLSKEEAEKYEAFVQLKVAPKDLQSVVQERDDLKARLEQREREAAREAAAKALGLEGKDIASFANADALTYEVREETVLENGEEKKINVPYVKDAEGKEHKLLDFGKANWGRPFEVLVTEQKSEPNGTRYIRQSGTPATTDAKKTDEQLRQAVDATADYLF